MRNKINNTLIFLAFSLLLFNCDFNSLFDYDYRDDFNKKSISYYYEDITIVNFIEALTQNNFTLAKNLLDTNNIDTNIVGKEGVTPLFLCFVYGNIDAFSKILEWGADPNFVAEGEGRLLINYTISIEDSRFLEVLLDNGGNPDIKVDNNEYALNFSILDGRYLNNFILLLEKGANPDVTLDPVVNPALKAISARRYYYCQLLFQYGSQILEYDELRERFISKMETYTQAMFSDELKEQKALVKYLEENHGLKIKLKAPLGTL